MTLLAPAAMARWGQPGAAGRAADRQCYSCGRAEGGPSQLPRQRGSMRAHASAVRGSKLRSRGGSTVAVRYSCPARRCTRSGMRSWAATTPSPPCSVQP